jgi:PAS domain S-box-containing protein
MILANRLPLLTIAIALVASVLVFDSASLNDALQLAIIALIVLLVIILVYLDFTRQKKSETDISRLAAIVSLSEDAIVMKTLDGTIQMWNPGAERLFGYAADEVVGKSIQIIYPPDRLHEFQTALKQLGRGESIDHFDTVRVAKDGRWIDVTFSETLIRDARGRVIGSSKVMRDITQRKHAEETALFSDKSVTFSGPRSITR